MRIHPECLPCFISTSLRAAELMGLPMGERWEIARKVAEIAARLPEEWPPIRAGELVQRTVERIAGRGDPFARVKRMGNERALALLPEMRERVRSAPDPLEEALRIAVAGNLIDFGVRDEIDWEGVLRKAEEPSPYFRYDLLRKALERSGRILYIGDNTGEIAWDRLVVEELLAMGKEVSFAVRSGPALNDATRAEAEEVGLTGICEVIETGTAMPGVFLPRASPEFLERYREADLVLSKGMGNFEGLSDEEAPIFFLLVAKCVPVARELGVPTGAAVLLPGRRYRERG